MSKSLDCQRCLRHAPVIEGITYPGALGEELSSRICADCWAEWQQAEVMIINELRLDFMSPRSREILVQHMREFLGLPAAPAS